MTAKAQNIMNRIRERDERRRVFARLNDPRHRNHLVGDINLLDQDDTSRVGNNDQEIKVLKEMNELQDFENENWSRGSV
jgi:hypothetical protein